MTRRRRSVLGREGLDFVSKARDLTLPDVERLLLSPWHEERMLAVVILVHRFSRPDAAARRAIFALYLRRRRRINNWDLVDVSAEHILGPSLTNPRVRALQRSSNVWDRRMAVLATGHQIRAGRYAPTLAVAGALLTDRHDLIHKAVGWMLREVGKRDLSAETRFLDRHAARMPRTMLRYATERFPERLKRRYLLKTAGKWRGRVPVGAQLGILPA